MKIIPLDKRIYYDISERLANKPIKAAEDLAAAIRVNSIDATDGFSTLGLPGYFCGERLAKTVIVNLNPGMDAHLADCMWYCKTMLFDHSSVESFIKEFNSYSKNYGIVDSDRYDSFDVKQAAFFYDWKDSGINLPEKTNGWDDEAFWKPAKKAVLCNKLQLELVPYASAKFSIKNFDLFFQYIETLFDEIFKQERTYVVFASALFEKIFKAYNDTCADRSFDVNIDPNEGTKRFKKKDNTDMRSDLRCRMISIVNKSNKKQQVAQIAHSFPSQSIGKAFDIMREYGQFCHSKYLDYKTT